MGCGFCGGQSSPKVRERKTEIFEYKIEKDRDAFVMKFLRNDVTLTWRQFIAISKEENKAFVNIIKEAILSTNFKAVFFNCPPVTRDDLNNVFEVAILNAPDLYDINTDVNTFGDKFKGKTMVTAFANLSGDSLMVCPIPLEDQKHEIYSSLGPFLRSAPIDQQTAFWALIGNELFTLISKRRVWLNTAGGAISFLHMRLDSKPKYYKYRKFMNRDYYKEKVNSADH